tara:strand:- start:3286 stop:3570 length:285 start_codon:yes stop_codon:yes gene_type:complete
VTSPLRARRKRAHSSLTLSPPLGRGRVDAVLLAERRQQLLGGRAGVVRPPTARPRLEHGEPARDGAGTEREQREREEREREGEREQTIPQHHVL